MLLLQTVNRGQRRQDRKPPQGYLSRLGFISVVPKTKRGDSVEGEPVVSKSATAVSDKETGPARRGAAATTTRRRRSGGGEESRRWCLALVQSSSCPRIYREEILTADACKQRRAETSISQHKDHSTTDGFHQCRLN